MIKVDVKLDKVDKSLLSLDENIENAIADALMAIALDAQNIARKSILKGAKTGYIYGRGGKFKRGKNKGNYRSYHKSSAPGQPPANDTGFLANRIIVGEVNKKLVELRSLAPYSADLEYGTYKMAARPFLRPAAWSASLKADKTMAAYANKAINKAKK